MVLITQSLAQVAEPDLRTLIDETTQTKVFLPNPSAIKPATRRHYEALGLSDRLAELIAGLTPKRDDLYLSRYGCRVFQIGATELAPLLLTPPPGKTEEAPVEEVRQIQLQIQALEKLDAYWFRSVDGAIGQMESTLGWYDLLSHMGPGIDGTFQRTFPGWVPPDDWWAEEQEAATRTLDTLRVFQTAVEAVFPELAWKPFLISLLLTGLLLYPEWTPVITPTFAAIMTKTLIKP